MNSMAEIIRHDHCKPADQSFYAWKLDGKQRVGLVTTEHSASSYGQPVILVAQWGGLIDYDSIESVDLMGGDDDEITEADVAEVSRRLSNFGIKVGKY